MDVKLPLYRQHRLSVPNSIQRLQPKRKPGVLKALHPEKFFKNSRGGSTKQRLCDRRSAHWGTEGMLYPDQSQRHLAEQIAQAGADVISRRTSAPASGRCLCG